MRRDLVGKSGIDADFQTVGNDFTGRCHTPDNDTCTGRQQLRDAVVKGE